eukprot:6185802-Pleurochrysis_carterae.AAC.3
MSCGGTTFVWQIAPYGLTNMPAIYSRAAQHVCRGLQDHNLGYALGPEVEALDVQKSWLGKGSLNSWLDDLTIAMGEASPGLGVRGHCQMMRRIFERLTAAYMTQAVYIAHLAKIVGGSRVHCHQGRIQSQSGEGRSLAQNTEQIEGQEGSVEVCAHRDFYQEIHSATGAHRQSPVQLFEARRMGRRMAVGRVRERLPLR